MLREAGAELPRRMRVGLPANAPGDDPTSPNSIQIYSTYRIGVLLLISKKLDLVQRSFIYHTYK
jgi:hypothetical protein